MTSGAQAKLVDGLLSGRALVFGSLPPDGRDLDLLVADDAVERLGEGLAAAGFVAKGEEWARFRDCAVESLDVVGVSNWRLPANETARLFADASPLAGHEHLARLSPADELLVLARRLGGGRKAPAGKHRARIAAALDRDPGAWDVAAGRARTWRARRRLAWLQRAYEWGAAPTGLTRRMARYESARGAGRAVPRALLYALRSSRPRRGPSGAVISIAGLDGAGKSTQAEALADILAQLGYPSGVQWSRITYDHSLRKVARPLKLALGAVVRVTRRVPEVPPDDPSTRPPRAPDDAAARALRSRVPVLNRLWAAVVAGIHAWGLRRALRLRLRAGDVVVRDRYLLDSTVQLRQLYGHRGEVGLAVALLRWIAPPELIGFWLDVPGEVAYSRKPEQFSVERLSARRRLYEEALPGGHTIRIDGTRPPEEICAEIARMTWLALP